MWITDLFKIDVENPDSNSELRKLGKVFDDTREALNHAIQSQESGDQTLLVDT